MSETFDSAEVERLVAKNKLLVQENEKLMKQNKYFIKMFNKLIDWSKSEKIPHLDEWEDGWCEAMKQVGKISEMALRGEYNIISELDKK